MDVDTAIEGSGFRVQGSGLNIGLYANIDNQPIRYSQLGIAGPCLID
jgi:hypothetical protein